MGEFSEVTLNMSGIREILKGSGVSSALQAAGDKIAGCANANQRVVKSLEVPAYRASVDETRHTNVARVFTASRMGRLDELKNKTLENSLHQG